MVIGSLTQLPKGQGRSGYEYHSLYHHNQTKGTGLITAWPVVSSAH
ncbi:hypothetical protein FOQG_00301 [Fusarium oxysporum f. sp. raphani 54005]|uniref:Uncharacterized protein n=6 Tax=Fusarium oxysporum TaxID=5507 RepID=X0D0H7_FUSOX|nr:hypothetical protein FOXG_18136 [Fusarium oxysporum f. sp. lycopersici 4287]EWZ45424.1 hypothetical protein FOZG_05743 [Fusarium oxysporum Fo47]EWZ97758.1 hypothetical protein FOWG_02136 [Fusarium oxysporum f. sp. lycopersici MN25]EXA50690.1 hypothetical protein FOVG_03276 [Fusarium oxysporum f. sp. pisi HDV247]EXK42825.1 hypothetical protein FOMG_05583 [Fusarium oxysporum f. sp. melonis 26406]EXK99926.1 hypothetical protein FOQG_00301 [Fusarium oxysporum f. sp. raphani 54005]EXL82217.1 hy